MRVTVRSILHLAAAALLGTALLRGSPAMADTIPIGVGIDPAFVPFFVAKRDGIFQKHGLDVRLVSFSQGGDSLDAMVAGQVVMTASAEPSAMIRMARADVHAIGIVEQSGSYLKMAVRSGIDDPKQIRTLGAVPGGAMEYLAGISIAKFGLDPATTKIVKAGVPEMPALLARGDIDAFWLFEPFPSMAARNGGKIMARSQDVGYTYTFWITSMQPWLAAHPDDTQKILASLAEACELTTSDPEKAAAAVQAEVKIPTAQTLGFLKEVDCKMRDFTPADDMSFGVIAKFLATAKITPSLVDYRSHLNLGTYKP